MTSRPIKLPPLTPNASLRWDIVSRLIPSEARTVIEVGCGQGAAGARLAVRSDDYLGLEPDADSCSVAAARLAAIGKGTVRRSTVPEDAPADQLWDLLCSFEVIEHIEDDSAALKAWTGVVRPGGWVILSTPSWSAHYGPQDAMVGHFRRYDPSDLKELMEGSGLQDVRLVNYGAGLGNVLELGRKIIGARRLRRAGQPVPHGAPVAIDAATMAEFTAGSGRLFQPPAAATAAVRAATAPFVALQRLFPHHGPGLVAIGQRAD